MSQDSDPAAGPNTEAAGIAAAEAAPMSVELDPSDIAGFTANSPSIRHMLNKIEAYETAIIRAHDDEHDEVSRRWCPNILCRTMQDWR